MNGAKKWEVCFVRVSGERAQSYCSRSPEHSKLLYGDIRQGPSGVFVFGPGGALIPTGGFPGYRNIGVEVTERIQDPVEFYSGIPFVADVGLSPVAHAPLLYSAAGNRPVTTQRPLVYDNRHASARERLRISRFYILVDGRRVELNPATPAELLRD